jgi:hypothetical protein
MSPAEQLVRDYLSRLSAAARGQLSPEDRRALVGRTREVIEQKTRLGRPPTTIEVARLLSGLGDPAGLVSQERQRLATLRGEELKPASRGRMARILRGDPDRARGSSWHWPVQEGSADLQLTLLNAAAPAAANGSSSNGAGSARKPSGAATRDANGGSKVAGPHARDVDGMAALVAARSADVTPPGDVTDISASRPPDTVPPEAGSVTWQPPAPAGSRRARAATALGRLAGWARRNKIEAFAVVLLGIGAIVPPVWLVGAAVALASRLWDLRDKWLALGVPVLLTVIGLAGGVAAAGSGGTLGHHLHEGWVFADVISRLTALLSACYLAGRSAHGRRPPATPPWSKPRNIA